MLEESFSNLFGICQVLKFASDNLVLVGCKISLKCMKTIIYLMFVCPIISLNSSYSILPFPKINLLFAFRFIELLNITIFILCHHHTHLGL